MIEAALRYQEGFNRGADSRLAADPMTANPYPSEDNARYRGWRDGWLDVDYNWGRWARWPHVALPGVRETVAGVRT